MAIEYILNYDCEAKRALGGIDGFLETMKYAGRAQSLAEMAREDPDFSLDRPIQHVLIDPSGQRVTREESFHEIKERGDRIQEYASLCSECPANILGKPGGCCGAINYPITAQAERWVLDVLPDNLEDSIRGNLLKQYIKDFGRNAKFVDRMRRSDMFYELRKPLVDIWGKGLFGKTTCTSSVILGNLYGIGPEVSAFHGVMMCYFMGAIDCMPMTSSPNEPNWMWDMDTLPDDKCVRGLAWLLRAYYQACLLDVTTLMEP